MPLKLPPSIMSKLEAAQLRVQTADLPFIGAVPGFIHAIYRKPWDPNIPVLLRAVLFPLTDFSYIDPNDALRHFPATFLYGGPTLYKYLTNEQGKRFQQVLRYWAMSQQKNIAMEIVPIAPSGYAGAPVWPRQGWGWDWVREAGPAPKYAIYMATPTRGEWRQV